MRILSVVLFLCLALSSGHAAEWTVEPDGSGDFLTIQAALAGVAEGDIILLGDGTFTGPGNRDVDWLGKAVTVRSASGDSELCVIDCQASGRGFRFVSGEGPGSVLEGISIINGFVEDTDYVGGAVHFGSSTSPTVVRCNFRYNVADVGGALGGVGNSAPHITECTFEDNEAFGGGAACFWGDAQPVFVDCDFVQNQAAWGGGLAYSDWDEEAFGDLGRQPIERLPEGNHRSRGYDLSLQGCSFFRNSSEAWTGGGVFLEYGLYHIESCSFTQNSGDGWADGGSGLRISGPTDQQSVIVNCSFTENWGDESGGGGIHVSGYANLLLENCIFAFHYGRAIREWGATLELSVHCTDIYGNEGGDWYGSLAPFEGINGNFSEDPLFCGYTENELTLDVRSPCLPEHNDCGVLIGSDPQGCDLYDGVYLVLPDGTGDFPTIQEAIDASFTEVVELGDGVFTGSMNCDLEFHGLPITVRSVSGDPFSCILDGQGEFPLDFDDGEGPETRLERIMLRGSSTHTIRCLGASPTIRGCLFEDFSGSEGTAIYMWDSSSLIENCTVVGSERTGYESSGSPLYLSDSFPTILNTVIAFNDCDYPVECEDGESAQLSCCLVYGNKGGDWIGCLEGQDGMNRNLWEHPKFCGEIGGGSPLSLTLDSPCLPENNSCAVNIGALGLGCEVSAYSIEGWVRDTGGYAIVGTLFDFPLQMNRTNATGFYRLWYAEGSRITVTPQLIGYAFEPVSRQYTAIAADFTDQDYTGTRDIYLEVPLEFATIQSALDFAHDGDTILVAPGTYSGAGNRDLSFAGKSICLLSSGGSEQTIINASGGARSFVFQNGESPAAVVQGFTLTGGSTGYGGGIKVYDSSPTFIDLVITGNTVLFDGGGMFISEDSSPRFEHLSIVDNSCGRDGAGIAVADESHPVFEKVLIVGNTSADDGGGVYLQQSAFPEFINVTIAGNECVDVGAGIFFSGYSSFIFSNSIVAFNEGGYGIHSLSFGVDPDIACSDVYGNGSGEYGGRISDQTGVAGNISANPLFCDYQSGDYTLDYASPCMPSNNDCGVLMGALDAACGTPTEVPETAPGFSLAQNIPNPFNPRTEIRFSLERSGPVTVEIYDVSGRMIRRLLDKEFCGSGTNHLSWDGSTDTGSRASSGVYFYRITTPGFEAHRKMVLLK